MFVPANFMDYTNKSESSFVEPTDVSDAVTQASKCRWGTNSRTSEEDDSGLYSPPAEKEEKQGPASGDQPQMRSLSSAEDIHISEPYRPLFSDDSVSEQKIPLLSCRTAHPGDGFQVIPQDVSPLDGNKCVSGQRVPHGGHGCVQSELRESTNRHTLVVPRNGGDKCVSNSEEKETTFRQGESQIVTQSRERMKEHLCGLEPSPTDLGEPHVDFASTGLLENAILLTQYESAECNRASKDDVGAPFSAQQIEVTQKKCSLQFIPVKKKTGPRKTGVQAGTLDTVCNGFQVINGTGKPQWQLPVVLSQCGQE